MNYLSVLVEVGGVGEGPGTVVAAEGSLPCVSPHVLGERPPLAERALAVRARVRRAARHATLVRRPARARHEPSSTQAGTVPATPTRVVMR